jgi:hypothetical protein
VSVEPCGARCGPHVGFSRAEGSEIGPSHPRLEGRCRKKPQLAFASCILAVSWTRRRNASVTRRSLQPIQ